MSYELKKPVTDEERTNFIQCYNRLQGLKIEDTEMFLFALEANEIMGEKEIEIDVPDYETVIEEYTDENGEMQTSEVQKPVIFKIEEAIAVPDYDEEGNQIGEHEEMITKFVPSTHRKQITIPYPVVDPNYEQEQATRREAEFNKAFFNTSLGYIRRSVTMADGSKKDFLSDLLLPIKAGLELGQTVEIITYSKPDFTEDVTDWTQYQTVKNATSQFISECLQQVVADFGAFNNENTAD